MRITKNDKARVIVQALYNIAELPASNNKNVKRIARRKDLDWLYTKAVKVLQESIK